MNIGVYTMQSIFKYFTLDDDDETMLRTVWFTDSFDLKEFSGIDKVMYLYLEYCARLSVVAKRKYLDVFLRTDGKRLILKNNIKLSNMGAYDYLDPSALDEAFRIIASSSIQFYESAILLDIADSSFKVAMDTWMNNQKLKILKETMANNFPRASQGNDIDEVAMDITSSLDRMAVIYAKEKLDELDFLNNKLGKEDDNSGSMIFVAKTHIAAIDNDLGGVFKSLIYTFVGLTGSGKSRFIYRAFVYVAAVFYGVSVRVDSFELGIRQVENILIAMHITTLFGGKIKIPDKIMNNNTLSEEQRRYYYAAKEDLFNNKENKYGKIYISNKSMYIEEFRGKVLGFLRLHKDIQIWVIDGPGLVRSNNTTFKRYGIKAEIIEDVYSIGREISMDTGLTWVMVNQYNKTGGEKAKAGKEIDQGDIQGGQSTHQYTDYNMYTTQTSAQKQVGMFEMTVDKVRGANGFYKVPFKTDLAISAFRQQAKEVTR